MAAIWSGVGRLADRGVAHHHAPHGRVAHEEPGVDRQVAVEPVQPLTEAAPVPRRAGLERVERHALDPRHHPHDVVDVARAPSGAMENPQLPPMHGRDAVQRRRADRRVPQQPARRSACGCRRTRARPRGRRRRWCAARARRRGPRPRRCGRRGRRRRPRERRRAGAVDHGAAADRRSSMVSPPQLCWSSAATALSTAVPAKNVGIAARVEAHRVGEDEVAEVVVGDAARARPSRTPRPSTSAMSGTSQWEMSEPNMAWSRAPNGFGLGVERGRRSAGRRPRSRRRTAPRTARGCPPPARSRRRPTRRAVATSCSGQVTGAGRRSVPTRRRSGRRARRTRPSRRGRGRAGRMAAPLRFSQCPMRSA